jgi:hypothetical protein
MNLLGDVPLSGFQHGVAGGYGVGEETGALLRRDCGLFDGADHERVRRDAARLRCRRSAFLQVLRQFQLGGRHRNWLQGSGDTMVTPGPWPFQDQGTGADPNSTDDVYSASGRLLVQHERKSASIRRAHCVGVRSVDVQSVDVQSVAEL